ncbi:MAG: response regulator transcription factor, partial [Solirubrobacterales bacterium]
MPEREELARIVVCEDDEATLGLLGENLLADRYGVEAAPTAADALRHCQYWRPDLLIIDLYVPDASGLDVLRELREPDRSVSRFDPDLAVLVLSGRGSERDRVRGLQQGADDFLVKPFHYPELLARVEAVLRRRGAGRPATTRVAEIEINREERTVVVGGERVSLSAKEFSLLVMLASEPTRVFAKEELLRDVWGYQ